MKRIDISIPLDPNLSTCPDDIRVPVETHNSRLGGSPEFHADYVGITESGARRFVDRGVKVVGVDCLPVEEYKKLLVVGSDAALARVALRRS